MHTLVLLVWAGFAITKVCTSSPKADGARCASVGVLPPLHRLHTARAGRLAHATYNLIQVRVGKAIKDLSAEMSPERPGALPGRDCREF